MQSGPATGCADPEPILQKGTAIESGFVRCADGFVHRTHAVTCVAPKPPSMGVCESINNPMVCPDTDCVARPYGACLNTPPFGDCACTYGCATDADCDAGEICACAGVIGPRCIPAGCAASSECGEGLCGLRIDVDACGGSSGRLACHDDRQECRVDADCGAEEEKCDLGSFQPKNQCRLEDGVWSCRELGLCLCG